MIRYDRLILLEYAFKIMTDMNTSESNFFFIIHEMNTLK